MKKRGKRFFKKPAILLIEDENYLREIYLDNLKFWGYPVKTFLPSENLLEKVAKNTKIVILDWELKKWRIKNSSFIFERLKDKKIVLISENPEKIPKNFRKKAYVVIKKPINFPYLRKVLMKLTK